ncbi:hypothetical protein EV356DRAFT_244673 [Viridothelium virens]|uniref:Uncharacterized protein n=1 Tax=Viridothelium virens TaxID=1048519 RepID=A0A6A6H405_VIRVR|nr:hypothetical protein EV356DRAFT_244673 [Viridothelium virens]
MIKLPKVLCDRCQAGRAARMLEDIIPTVTRTLGCDHAAMKMTESNLAHAFVILQSYSEAEMLLSDFVRTLPANQASWVHAICGCIHVQTILEHFEVAERMCERLLESVEKGKTLAHDDPKTLATAQILLRIYSKQERWSDIARLKRRVPAMSEQPAGQSPSFRDLYGARKDQDETRMKSSPMW